jgi:hypothetical protein
MRLTSLLSGPVDDLAGYIPDFGFELYDLHRYTDDEIKGTIASRLALLLLKHIRDPDLDRKLPGIFALLRTLMEKETGLQWLEVVIRYLASARDDDDLSEDQIKEIVEQAISKDLGGFVMTLAEIKGEIKAFREGIELGITYKFPGDIDAVMTEVNKIDDPATLKEITKAVHTAKDISEIMALLK